MPSDSSLGPMRRPAGPVSGGGPFVARLAGVAVGAGCVAVLAFVSQASTWAEYGRMVSALLMVGGCAWSAGALVGFLFGIPRTLSSPPDGLPTNGMGGPAPVRYRVNTNLEQVSDWLTKILIGAGLAELYRMPGALRAAADYFSVAIGGSTAAALSGFVVALLVYFSIVGLMTGYLGTRVLLTPIFKLADARQKSTIAG